jgi:hypothetical protein
MERVSVQRELPRGLQGSSLNFRRVLSPTILGFDSSVILTATAFASTRTWREKILGHPPHGAVATGSLSDIVTGPRG